MKSKFFDEKYLGRIPNEILKKFFEAKDFEGQTFLFSYETNDQILNFIERKLDSTFLKKYLFERDRDGNLFLTLISPLHFKEILNHFNDETKRQIFLHQNKIGENFLYRNVAYLEIFLDSILKDFGEDFDFFNELFNTKNKSGKTLWNFYKEKKSDRDAPKI